MKSVVFANCIGVFEGGGVKGVAYAGAYRKAFDYGINFLGTIGTSAGSIVAAFIAAGINPEEAIKEMGINFYELIAKAQQPESDTSRFMIKVSSLFGKKIKEFTQSYFSLGRYSSLKLETWVNEVLSRHLSIKHDRVRFRDLPKPLAIIAADLTSRGPKIWSLNNTPDSPVAFAVRASCTIPFFFQPVEGESFYVDGGLISNLPIFLIPELELPAATPVLCFRLISDRFAQHQIPTVGTKMLHALVDTILNGVTEIQLKMSQNHQIININTGDIGATDFNLSNEKISKLISAGENALDDFVKNEQIRVAASSLFLHEPLRSYREGLLEQTSDLISYSTGDIWIIAGNLTWFKELQVFLLSARLKGQKIRVLAESNSTSEYEEAIAGALAIGAEVVETNTKMGIRGTIINPETELMKMILIEKEPRPHGRYFDKEIDLSILSIILGLFKNNWHSGRIRGPRIYPTLQEIPNDEIIRALKLGVPQYSELQIEIKEISIKGLLTLTKYLENLKLKRINELEKILSKFNLPNAVRLLGSPWPFTPPVIEVLSSGKMVIIDGAHRIYLALRNGIDKMKVILIYNPKPNLPSAPFPNWNHIKVDQEKKPREERYKNFNQLNFRPIRTAFKVLAKSS